MATQRQWLAEQLPTQSSDTSVPPSPRAGTAAGRAIAQLEAGSIGSEAFAALSSLADSQQLSLRLVAAEPRQLSVQVFDRDQLGVTLVVEPRRQDGRYFKSGATLGIWYRSEGGPESERPAWMLSFLSRASELLLGPRFAALADELATKPPTKEPAQGPIESHESDAAGGAGSYSRPNVLGPSDVERFFHVDYEYEPDADVDQPPTCRIGIIYQCNQPCTFCQLAEMNTHIPPARIHAALDASRARGAQRVILTGGEPTLCKHLPEYIAYAREIGFTTIELQTNATLLDNSSFAERLRRAGLTDAQVSLHGPDSQISDRLTAAPGTHQRTLRGIDNLLATGARVLLNHLIFRDNCHLLLDFVEMIERRWGTHRAQLILQFHTPLNEFARPEHGRKHIARYSDYAPLLRQAIDRARAFGIHVKDLQDPTGVPALCLFGADSEYLGKIASQKQRPRTHRWESGWMMRVEACASCDAVDACLGVPKTYVALHGESEFRPIRFRASE